MNVMKSCRSASDIRVAARCWNSRVSTTVISLSSLRCRCAMSRPPRYRDTPLTHYCQEYAVAYHRGYSGETKRAPSPPAPSEPRHGTPAMPRWVCAPSTSVCSLPEGPSRPWCGSSSRWVRIARGASGANRQSLTGHAVFLAGPPRSSRGYAGGQRAGPLRGQGLVAAAHLAIHPRYGPYSVSMGCSSSRSCCSMRNYAAV